MLNDGHAYTGLWFSLHPPLQRRVVVTLRNELNDSAFWQPFTTADLNRMAGVSQTSLVLTLFVGLMTIIDTYIVREAKLAASGPWGDDEEDFMAAANRAVLSVLCMCVQV